MDKQSKPASPVDAVIAILGTQTALAEALGVPRQNVAYWARTGRLPREYIPRIAELTALGPRDLAPDIFERVAR